MNWGSSIALYNFLSVYSFFTPLISKFPYFCEWTSDTRVTVSPCKTCVLLFQVDMIKNSFHPQASPERCFTLIHHHSPLHIPPGLPSSLPLPSPANWNIPTAGAASLHGASVPVAAGLWARWRSAASGRTERQTGPLPPPLSIWASPGGPGPRKTPES